MSIASFKKISVLGLTRCKEEILNALQELGCLHLISVKSGKPNLIAVSTTLVDNIKNALRYLKDSPEQGRQRLIWKDFNAEELVNKILKNKKAMQECMDRHDFLANRIRELSEWGHFELASEDFNGIKLWFYKINLKDRSIIPEDVPALELYRNHRFIYLVILSKEEPKEDTVSPYRIHTGSVALNFLLDELETIKDQMEDLKVERRNFTRYRYLLSQEVAHFVDRTQFKKASDKTLDKKEFFLLQGWLPDSKLSDIQQFCESKQLGFSIEEPQQDELPPTLLDSPSKAGQEIVKFYQTPGYHSLDPSIIVFFSFSIFFAMILADAGYGIILGLMTLLSWRRLGKNSSFAWLKSFLVSISGFSIIYGVLIGSYWGVPPKPGSFLSALKIIDIHNFNAMMALVLCIGCFHIMIASFMRAWFVNNVYERMQAIGFMLLIMTALLFSVGIIISNSLITRFSIGLFAISLLMIMFFASNERVTNGRTFLLRIFHGLTALTELPSLFGDILSYLRLFALGLAGASLALTFNTMAQNIAQYSWVLAFIVLLLGQTLNFLLCLLSAVIHGLRLNYIEFFKWSIKEDGYNYQPFKKEETPHE
ncbi:V-type ATP synthase subunit I [Legionella brunensis]|uniref:V-type ATP synthase subunit I n=1 Tax=Legionella brunensis TaxID=29422 RepID=A0A0W0SNA1_9GAMM|nr:V-type ATPase 116kDa subunit family protein [Legionella brunensis]KTC84453.1 V-type ATP synthase subunit I [Legionella brunensis]